MAVSQWFASIVDRGDLQSVWPVTDEPLRLALLQSWILSESIASIGDRVQLAESLVASVDAPRWNEFEVWRLSRWRQITFREAVERGWGVLSVPEPVGQDAEFVRICPGNEFREVAAGQTIRAYTFVARLSEDGWRVAGIGRTIPAPGWPPTERVIY